MVTSSYMPDVKVEVAFNAGFSTPAASRVWTDVSDYVELNNGIGIGFGRSDELSTAGPNTLTITLDNSDGRFTASRSASPYHPNVRLYRPIRVTATPVGGGAASVRFTGYINQWPTQWDGTSAYARATLTASSRLARLGLTTKFRSVIEQEILADSPVAYYTLGEAAGATSAADTSGRGAASLTLAGEGAPVVFGNATGPGTDGLTAAEFADGQFLTAFDFLDAAASNQLTVAAFMLCPAPALSRPRVIALSRAAADGGDFGLALAVAPVSGFLRITDNLGSVVLNSTVQVADGLTHHVAFTRNGANVALFVDGVQVASTGGYSGTAQTLVPSVGGTPGSDVNVLAAGLTGVVSHVAFYKTALSSTRIAAHASAGLTGYVGDSTDQRFDRYAEYASIPAAEVTSATGSTTMGHVDTTGRSVVDLLRIVESTEGGVVYDARDGNLVLTNRGVRYTAASAITLDMAAQRVEADFAPKMDASTLLNTMTAQNIDGTVQAQVVDQASVDEYGEATGSIETASSNPDEPFAAASWRVNAGKEPANRVPSLTVDLLSFSTADQNTLLGLTVGSLITVTNQPAQAPSTSDTYFVEGCTDAIGPESYRLTFNLSPGEPYLDVFIIDSATRGLIDTNIIGY